MLLNRGKNPIMLGAPGVPVARVGLQRVNHSTSNVGLVDHSRVHLLLLGRIGGITRNFTTTDRAFGMYYSIPTYVMAVGDTVEFKYLAPTATVPTTDELIGGDITGGSDARFNMFSGGGFADAGFENTFLLDGAPVATTSNYPIDGDIHSVLLTSNSTLSISALCARQNATNFCSGIMYDFVIKNSSGGIQHSYAIDEDWVKSNVLVDGATVLGSEKVINGDFATDTFWVKGGGWTISSGEAHNDGTGNFTSIGNPFLGTVGTTYLVTFDVTAYTSGDLIVAIGGAVSGNIGITGVGTYQVVLPMTTNTNGLNIQTQSFFNGSIDNASVKEASGYGMAVNIDEDDSEPFTFDGVVSPNTWTNDGATRILEIAGT